MQRILPSLPAALAALPLAASATTIFPNLAAHRYCELRSVGVEQQPALSAAIRENLSSEEPVMTMRNGKPQDTNVSLMAIAIYKQCPEYLPK